MRSILLYAAAAMAAAWVPQNATSAADYPRGTSGYDRYRDHYRDQVDRDHEETGEPGNDYWTDISDDYWPDLSDVSKPPWMRNELVFGNSNPQTVASGHWEKGYYFRNGQLRYGFHEQRLDYGWDIRRTRELQGEVRTLNLIGGRDQPLVVSGTVETANGLRGVILGPASRVRPLHVQVGDRVSLEGETTMVDDMPTLLASRIRLPGRDWVSLGPYDVGTARVGPGQGPPAATSPAANRYAQGR